MRVNVYLNDSRSMNRKSLNRNLMHNYIHKNIQAGITYRIAKKPFI